MIHINEGQAQLSGWGYSAEPESLFIDKVPEPFMVGQTISAAATRGIGGTELHFSDGTILYYHQGYGLFPALENVTVWTVPAEGTTVSNTLEYVEINASYTTKSGKVIKAIPVKVPVAVPKFLRVIVPEEPLIDEGFHLKVKPNWYDTEENGVEYRGYNRAFFNNKAYLVVDWADKHDVIFRTTRCDNSKVNVTAQLTPLSQGSNYAQVSRSNQSQTVTRYRTPEDEGSTITIEDAHKFTFKYRINNTTLTCETYFDVNTIVEEGLFNLRESYAGTTEYTIDVDRNTRTVFRNGKVIIGRYAYSGLFMLEIYLVYWDWMGWMVRSTKQTITLKDGEDKNLREYYRLRYGYGVTTWQCARQYHYKCEDGEVNWTEGDLYYWPNE